jgi:hypothetical protein
MLSQIIRSSVLGIAALLALIFIPAGTPQYWQGWAYVVIAIVASGAYTLYLARHDPALLKRRTEAGISYEKEPAQKSSYFLETEQTRTATARGFCNVDGVGPPQLQTDTNKAAAAFFDGGSHLMAMLSAFVSDDI